MTPAALFVDAIETASAGAGREEPRPPVAAVGDPRPARRVAGTSF